MTFRAEADGGGHGSALRWLPQTFHAVLLVPNIGVKLKHFSSVVKDPARLIMNTAAPHVGRTAP
eukprot:684419-Pyramimonas_sp.AAC.1